MLKHAMSRRVILYEALGFVLVILFLWANEVFDFPRRFLGMSPTPINIAECIYETIVIALFAIVIILLTRSLLRKIKLLEGFLPVCASCKKIRRDKDWVEIESYIRDHSEADFTHGLCPDCAKRLYGDKIAFSKDDKEE